VLGLQRAAGNAASGALVAGVLARQGITLEEVTIEGATPAQRVDKIRAIQRELRRLRLYSLRIDGIEGFFTQQGLTEAFGGHDWWAISDDEVLAALQAASRPAAGGGHQFRYGELFADGVLDVTVGLGYMEGLVEYVESVAVAIGRDSRAWDSSTTLRLPRRCMRRLVARWSRARSDRSG
jgi:hypothetical protein